MAGTLMKPFIGYYRSPAQQRRKRGMGAFSGRQSMKNHEDQPGGKDRYFRQEMCSNKARELWKRIVC